MPEPSKIVNTIFFRILLIIISQDGVKFHDVGCSHTKPTVCESWRRPLLVKPSDVNENEILVSCHLFNSIYWNTFQYDFNIKLYIIS